MARILTKKRRKDIQRGVAGFYCGPISNKAQRERFGVTMREQWKTVNDYIAQERKRLADLRAMLADLEAAQSKASTKSATRDREIANVKHAVEQRCENIRLSRSDLRTRLDNIAAGRVLVGRMHWIDIARPSSRQTFDGLHRPVCFALSKSHFRNMMHKDRVSFGKILELSVQSSGIPRIGSIINYMPTEGARLIRHLNSSTNAHGDASRHALRDRPAAEFSMAHWLAGQADWLRQQGHTELSHVLCIKRGPCLRALGYTTKSAAGFPTPQLQSRMAEQGIPLVFFEGGVHMRRSEFVRRALAAICEEMYSGKQPWKSDKADPFVGIELEMVARNCTNRDDMAMRILGYNKDLRKYVNVGTDVSVHADRDDPGASLEIRILSPLSELQDVLKEAHKAMAIDGGFYTNSTCGMHVHQDQRDFDFKTANRNLVCALPVLTRIVDPQRIDNRYCALNRTSEWENRDAERRLAINSDALRKHNTLEVRLHHGYEDPQRTLNWVQLTRMICDAPEFPGTARLLKHLAKCVDLNDDLQEYILAEYRRWNPALAERGVLLEQPDTIIANRIQSPPRFDPWELSDVQELSSTVAELRARLAELESTVTTNRPAASV